MNNSYKDLHSLLDSALQNAQQGVEQLQLNFKETSSNHRDVERNCFTGDSTNILIRPDSADEMSDSIVFLHHQDGIFQSWEQSKHLVSIDNVNSDLLHSGLAVYLGCCDRTRNAGVVLIYCKHPGWTSQFLTISHLSSLLLYYQHLCRKQLTLIVDARGGSREVIHALLETISELEMQSPGEGAIDIVHILADRISQALILRSPFFRNANRIHSSQIDLITSVDVIYRVVTKDHLPVEIGGYLPSCHLHWIRFRKLCDSLLEQFLEVVKILMKVTKHLSFSPTEKSWKSEMEIGRLISLHYEELETPLHVASAALHSDDLERKLQTMHGHGSYLSQHMDYRDSVNAVDELLVHLRKSVSGLSQLANARFNKLNLCLQVLSFEENCKKVLPNLDMISKEILEKHSGLECLSDNLLQLQVHQQEFLQVKQSAQAELLRAGDMLKLGQRMSNACDPVTVHLVEHFCCDLQQRIKLLSTRLDKITKTMDLMIRCSHLLTEVHGWIESAIKFFADANPSIQGTTLFDLEKYVTDLDNCLCEQPLSSADQISSIIRDGEILGSKQLVEQCMKVQGQYSEVVQLIKVRLNHLSSRSEKMRQQQFLPQRRTPSSLESINDQCDSLGFTRRRSYAGKPSTPMCSPYVEAFKRKDMDIQDYEEYLFSEGLITDDMSERIVASLPKGLSDVTMKGSRESLRSSKESLHGSQESIGLSSMSYESLASSCAYQDFKTNKLFGSPLRFFKKAVTFLTEGNNTQPPNSFSSSPAVDMENMDCHMKRVNEEQPGDKNGISRFSTSMNIPMMYDDDHVKRNTSSGSVQVAHSSSFNEEKSSEEAKRLRSQSHIMSEMIQTEKDYVFALEFVINNYMPELNRDDLVQPLRGKRNVIFGNLEKIYVFHSQFFLKELEKCCDRPLHVGATFLQHAPSFYLYALYSKNKPKSDALMKECGTGFFMKKQQELGEKLDLNSYLLKPVQRMGKYALLLEELLKECPESNSEHSILKEALEMVKFQLRHGNDLLAMDSIRRCDVNLQEQGRLLLQDSFSVTLGRHKMERHVFLFEDMVVFTKARRHGMGIDWLDYKDSFKTSDIGLTENVNNEKKFEIWFRKRTPNVTFLLEAPSADIKRLWISCLSRLLWKQAIRSRQRRRNELIEMGHDLKPGTDLTQSTNYIHDRMVPVTTHHKLSRIRNSIAVTSSDHFRTGYKRPHSMISVNSSFSGNSRSSGYFSNLSTTFELPTESVEAKEDATFTTALKETSCHTSPLWSSNDTAVDDGPCTDV